MSIRLRKKKNDGKAELRAVLGASEVPTFPAAVVKTLECLRSPDSSAAEVAAAMAVDPGLSVRLLKLVNSAGYSRSRPVESIDQAVAVAGFGAVESMVLSVGVTSALPAVDVDGHDNKRFWWAAGRRATVARAFALRLHPATASLSFTAGLLQDMAVPMLAAAREDYRPLLVKWHEGGTDLHLLEREAFGWSHDEIAGWLCEEWELPVALRNAIGAHHETGGEHTPPAVQLAAPFREVENQAVTEHVIAMAEERFGLDTETASLLIEEAEAEAGEVASMFI